ncbi:hypothetical protein CYFUS_002046 [Cystobacter fuscus]|uniref:Uncharacterized protein n=1 Tax=Cystobacter fuscus TaxID=43 RepID=A0A250IZP9_9BACT|nr:hypothetical protein CYFUS_002046 [Cystobacter fuscus]
MLALLLGTGVFLTIRLRFVQEVRFREAPRAMMPARSTGEGIKFNEAVAHALLQNRDRLLWKIRWVH